MAIRSVRCEQCQSPGVVTAAPFGWVCVGCAERLWRGVLIPFRFNSAMQEVYRLTGTRVISHSHPNRRDADE